MMGVGGWGRVAVLQDGQAAATKSRRGAGRVSAATQSIGFPRRAPGSDVVVVFTAYHEGARVSVRQRACEALWRSAPLHRERSHVHHLPAHQLLPESWAAS